MSKWFDAVGTTLSKWQIAIGGVILKNSSGLSIRNSTDTADAALTTSQVNVSGNSVVLNSAATESGTSWKATVARPTTGMSADVNFTLPPTNGTSGFVLQTDGAGNTSWIANAGATNQILTHRTALAFGSTSPVSLFTLPANYEIVAIRVYVDTAFSGGTAPSLSVGISGTTSKYLSSNQVDLTTVGIYEIYPGLTADVSSEALIATYAANSSTAGAARIETDIVLPS